MSVGARYLPDTDMDNRSSTLPSKSISSLSRMSGRSPDLRLIKLELPSQDLHPSGLRCSSSPRSQWRGRAGFSPASQGQPNGEKCRAGTGSSQELVEIKLLNIYLVP